MMPRTKRITSQLGLLLLGLSLLMAGCPCERQPGLDAQTKEVLGFSKNKDAFAFLFTTSVQGWVEPCGCTSDPLGGIARLATAVKSVRAHFTLGSSFIDGGNLLFETKEEVALVDTCQNSARVDLLLSTYKDLFCEGTFLQAFDLSMGQKFRDDVLIQHDIKDLTARARDGYVTGAKDFSLGVLAVDTQNANSLNEKAQAMKSEGANAVVAFSLLSRKETIALAAQFSDVDVIVLAAIFDEMPSSETVGPHNNLLVTAGKQGQYLGLIEFHKSKTDTSGKWKVDNRQQLADLRTELLVQRLESLKDQLKQERDEKHLAFLKSRIEKTQNEIAQLKSENVSAPLDGNYIYSTSIALSKRIPADPEFDERLKSYENEIPKLVAKCETNLECPKLETGRAKFVGAETCKACHLQAYDFWKKAVYASTKKIEGHEDELTGHSKAWATLEARNKTEDRTCVGCHSVGFMEPGGYCKVSEVGIFKNVQCENCHGAGSLHAQTGDKALISRSVPEATCRGCHKVPHIESTESFVYRQKLRKILGKGHGELMLQKLDHGL